MKKERFRLVLVSAALGLGSLLFVAFHSAGKEMTTRVPERQAADFGNIAPKRVLRTNAFTLPAGIIVSPEHDEMGILEAQDKMIMMFPRSW